jgi:hypothetical protein
VIVQNYLHHLSTNLSRYNDAELRNTLAYESTGNETMEQPVQNSQNNPGVASGTNHRNCSAKAHEGFCWSVRSVCVVGGGRRGAEW